jgi:hypothetical protein
LVTLEAGNRARITCFQFPDEEVRSLEYEGFTRSIITTPSLGAPHSYVDWDDDRAALKRALDYAVTHSAVGTVDRPKQMIEAALEVLTKNGSSADNRLEIYRLTRSRALAADARQLSTYASEFVTAIRNHPSLVAEIEQLKETERVGAKKAAEAEPIPFPALPAPALT